MHHVLIFTSYLTATVSKIIFGIFANLSSKGVENLKYIEGPVLIISNHSSILDPYVLTAGVPYKYLPKIVPPRFATYHRFYNNPLLKPFMYLWGCFPVYPKTGDLSHVLRSAIAITKDKREKSILIYPEGLVVKSLQRPPARPGISYLARESGWQILPVAVRGTLKTSLVRFITFRENYTVTFGKPFYYKDIAVSDDDIQTAQLIMDRVIQLFKL